MSSLFILILLPLTIYLIAKKSSFKEQNLPPGPFQWPLIGNIPNLIGKNPHIMVANLAKIHGPLMSLKLGTQLLIMGSSPQAATEILKTNDRHLSARYTAKATPINKYELLRFSILWAPECTNQWKSLRALWRGELFGDKALDLKEIFPAACGNLTTTIEWAMAELIKNKEAMNKLQREITDSSSNQESDITKLPYLNACVKETLRLHPPIAFVPHLASATCKVMNHTVPKGSLIMMNLWALGHDPNTWKDPFLFKPERFLDSDIDFDGHDFEYLPFGAGRRMCPGIDYATKQVHFIVASLVHFFDWSLPDNGKLDMNEKYGVPVQKEKPLILVPSKKF